jgi:hypothetical protein
MKTIIAGGRNYVLTVGDAKWLDGLRITLPITEVVCGEATGADAGGKKWALARGIPVKCFPADWPQFGKRAGPIRNEQMAEYAEGLIAFPGGQGTADMIRRANAKGCMVVLREK